MPPQKVPAALKRIIAGEVEKAIAADRAQRTQAAPADVSGKSGTQKLDVRTAAGFRIKSAFVNHPIFGTRCSDETRAAVKKSASAFEGSFGQGGSLLKEEFSSEIIEHLRPSTALLRAGCRVQTYVGKMTIGRLNGGATAQFVAETQAPTPGELKTGAVVLSSHKLMAIYEPSNDLLRNPSVDSAGILADDLFAAMGAAADKAGFLGDGTGPNPLGITRQVKASNKVAGVALTNANRDNVIRFIDSFEQKVKASSLELESNAPFWSFSSAVESALKGLYFEHGGWIFRDQLNQGKLNGKPVLVTEAYGDNHFFFGLAKQIYLGMDTKGGQNILIDMSEPRFTEDVTTIKAISYIDWKMRHDTAAAYSDNVTLG